MSMYDRAKQIKRSKKTGLFKVKSKGVRKEKMDYHQSLVKRERVIESKEQQLKKFKVRQPILEQAKSIWLTKRGYRFLRQAKLREKKSMAQVLDDLIFSTYGQVAVQEETPKQ